MFNKLNQIAGQKFQPAPKLASSNPLSVEPALPEPLDEKSTPTLKPFSVYSNKEFKPLPLVEGLDYKPAYSSIESFSEEETSSEEKESFTHQPAHLFPPPPKLLVDLDEPLSNFTSFKAHSLSTAFMTASLRSMVDGSNSNYKGLAKAHGVKSDMHVGVELEPALGQGAAEKRLIEWRMGQVISLLDGGHHEVAKAVAEGKHDQLLGKSVLESKTSAQKSPVAKVKAWFGKVIEALTKTTKDPSFALAVSMTTGTTGPVLSSTSEALKTPDETAEGPSPTSPPSEKVLVPPLWGNKVTSSTQLNELLDEVVEILLKPTPRKFRDESDSVDQETSSTQPVTRPEKTEVKTGQLCLDLGRLGPKFGDRLPEPDTAETSQPESAPSDHKDQFKLDLSLYQSTRDWPGAEIDCHEWSLELARDPDYRAETVPENLRAVRVGIPGRIRTAAELNDQQVTEVLNAQLQPVSIAAVGELLDQFPHDKRPLATAALEVLSRSASLDHYQSLADHIELRGKPEEENGSHKPVKLYSEADGSLADALRYTVSRKRLFDCKSPIELTNCKDEEPCLLLDQAMVKRLEDSPELVDEFVKAKSPVLCPSIQIAGCNPSTVASAESLQPKLSSIVAAAEKAKEAGVKASSDTDLVEQVLDSLARERLAAINPALLDRYETVPIKPLKTDESAGELDTQARIAYQLNGSQAITLEQTTKILDKVPEEWRSMARELVSQNSEVQSPRAMSQLARTQLRRIHEFAKTVGVEAEDIRFVVYDSKKSYGVYSHLFKEANLNQLRPSQFVSQGALPDVRENLKGKKQLYVILDDYAGSGESLLIDARRRVRNLVGKDPQIVCAPSISTTQAFEALNRARRPTIDPNCQLIAGRVIACVEDSPLAIEGDRAYRSAVIGGLGDDCGWSRTGSCVSLPYMGPDNNGSLFGGDMFNPFFVINGNTSACKSAGQVRPITDLLEPVARGELQALGHDLEQRPSLKGEDVEPLGDRVIEVLALAEKTGGISRIHEQSIPSSVSRTVVERHGERAKQLADRCREAREKTSPGSAEELLGLAHEVLVRNRKEIETITQAQANNDRPLDRAGSAGNTS